MPDSDANRREQLDALCRENERLRAALAESRNREEALQADRQVLRSLFDNLPFGLCRTLPSGQFLEANAALLQILGYPDLETLRATPVQEFYVNPAEREPWQAQLAEEGTLQDAETRARRRDGTYCWIRCSAWTVRDAAGNALYYESVIQDITERKRLQEQLLQLQKMESIGRLAGGIAHDFNNLLTAISGYSQIASVKVGNDHPAQSNLQQILRATDRAANLTRQMLTFARKQIIELKILSLHQILLDLDKMLRRLLGENGKLVIQPNAEVWPIKADSGQLEQILVNLVVNARDAMPNGGKVTIRFANKTLRAKDARRPADLPPGDYVLLSVEDKGVGIEKAVQTHIFEPFFTTKPPGKGTGLGLATCYGIVRHNGGAILVESEPGKGAIFRIFWPRAPETVLVPTPQLPEGMPTGWETLLLVEDESMVRDYAALALHGLGYTLLMASSGSEALQVVQEYNEEIHLLVTDVVMPQMTGNVLAERLLALRPGVKVLYTSGYTEDAIVQHGVLNAGVAFLQKPYSPDALARKVREVLDAVR